MPLASLQIATFGETGTPWSRYRFLAGVSGLLETNDRPQELVDRLATDDYTVNIGVLQVAHSIFKRWRPLFRSDELFTEINHVLQTFGAPFLGFTAVSAQ